MEKSRWLATLGSETSGFCKIYFFWFVPTIQGPIYRSILQALGKRGAETIILCHNVVQHSAGPADKKITSLVFKRADRLLVHTEALASLARQLTDRPIAVATMPAHLPGQPDASKHPNKLQHHLLF